MSLKKSSLSSLGYKSFEDWISDPDHVYIGRDMSHHIAGALGSKWGNPFKIKKRNKNKNSRKKCLERYEDHIRRNPDLFNAVMELEGKELGCWCKPSPCHGDILIKLFKERRGMNPCSSRSDRRESFLVSNQCGSNGETDYDGGTNDFVFNDISDMNDFLGSQLPERTGNDHLVPVIGNECQQEEERNSDSHEVSNTCNVSNHTPLRLTGGADITSLTMNDISEGLLRDVDLENSMSEQDVRDILYEAGYSIETIDEILATKVRNGLDQSSSTILSEETDATDTNESVTGSAFDILKDIRVKNVNKIIIGTLNINSLAPKFDQLCEVIGNNLDILTIQETKLDSSFHLSNLHCRDTPNHIG